MGLGLGSDLAVLFVGGISLSGFRASQSHSDALGEAWSRWSDN